MFTVSKPFKTNKQIVAFLSVLIGLLMLPYVPVKLLGMSAADKYRAVPLKYTNYSFIGEKMAQGGDVDILFVGSSDAWTAFDAVLIQEKLEQELGRPAVVLNFGTNWYGAESYYVRVKDALAHLEPKLIVVPDTDAAFTFPHELTHYVWSEPSGIAMSDIGALQAITLRGAALLGAPYLTVAATFSIWERQPKAQHISSLELMRRTNGFNGEKRGWLSHFDTDRTNRRIYEEEPFEPPVMTLSDLTYSGIENDKFENLYYTYNDYQSYFIERMEKISTANGAKFVTVSIPTHFKKKPHQKAIVRQLSREKRRSWPHLGVPMVEMFAGRDFESMKNFYSNESHLNYSGARVFSSALIPSFVEILENE